MSAAPLAPSGIVTNGVRGLPSFAWPYGPPVRAVRCVSARLRRLAARPCWLEWTGAALRPVVANGHAQTAAWRAAEGLHMPGLPDISRHALRVWGVTADGEATIRAACTSFVRVSPVSLMLSGLLRQLLRGDRPAGVPSLASDWTPPPPLGAL